MNFKEFKNEVLKKAKECGACSCQYQRAEKSETIEELIEVIKDNLDYVRNHQIVTADMGKGYERPELFNVGKENSGLFNSGDRNSGYRNSGDRNSGDMNSGDRNSGDRNSGDWNSGYRNSGDMNSGYRNSGVFCTRKREDAVPFFNKKSSMTWDEWYNHPAYRASSDLTMTEWVWWNDMTDKEKSYNPKAYVCDGYVKVLTYHQAWKNLWEKLSEERKDSFKTLPNFDTAIFKEVTGIDFK